MAKKALLMIIDGRGIGQHGRGDVIFNTPPRYLDCLTGISAHAQSQANGEAERLSDRQIGKSEV